MVSTVGVTFKWKHYRAKGQTKYKTMTLSAEEFRKAASALVHPPTLRFPAAGRIPMWEKTGCLSRSHFLVTAMTGIGPVGDVFETNLSFELPNQGPNKRAGSHRA